MYHFGWRTSFVILGGVSFVWVAIWYLYFRDDPSDHPTITAKELEALPPPRRSGPSNRCRGARSPGACCR